MSNVSYDLNRIDNIIMNRNYLNIYLFDKIYPNTNENIKDCFNNFDFKNKSCLSVLASGDQCLDMFLRGANNIVAFDINNLTKYYFYLKKAFLMSKYDYDEYCKFFFDISSDMIFSNDIFNDIKFYLPEESFLFWNTLFSKYDGKDIRLNRKIFIQNTVTINDLFKNLYYLNNKNNYNKLKCISKNIDIKFMNYNLKNINDNINNNFDFMYFSNIMAYIDDWYENRSISTQKNQIYKLQMFKNLILNLSNSLNDKGNILISYIFGPDITIETNCLFNVPIREKIFDKKNFKYIEFNSTHTNSSNTKDKCLIYTK